MVFDQNKYAAKYNKENYKMYQFRVKKGSKLIDYLDNMNKRNSQLLSIIENHAFSNILSLKTIKSIIKPILNGHGIHEIYLFGSYSRGEANSNSDIDILCERGNIKTFIDLGFLTDKLEEALGKKVDIIFLDAKMNDYFKKQIEEDLIKLC